METAKVGAEAPTLLSLRDNLSPRQRSTSNLNGKRTYDLSRRNAITRQNANRDSRRLTSVPLPARRTPVRRQTATRRWSLHDQNCATDASATSAAGAVRATRPA